MQPATKRLGFVTRNYRPALGHSEAFALIRETYNDAYAVAMEEFWFYYDLHLKPTVNGAVIHGVIF